MKLFAVSPNLSFPCRTTLDSTGKLKLAKMKKLSKPILWKHLSTLGTTFFPVNTNYSSEAVLLQFKRLANIYFLIIGILQSIPIISPLGPLTAWAPLIVVLAISVLREGTHSKYRRLLGLSAVQIRQRDELRIKDAC